MRVTYYYSACVAVSTRDVSVLCDPWFTEGVYDGAWYHWPPIDGDPVEFVGKHDFIYVSHLHPDHYDAQFLHSYLESYPEAQIIVAEGLPGKLLSSRMEKDGLECKSVQVMALGATILYLVAAGPGEIDSALLVARGDESVANMNDCIVGDQSTYKKVRELLGGSPSMALLSYTGAGSYPQSWVYPDHFLQIAASHKQLGFLGTYETKRYLLQAKVNMPFAGQYLLGGRLADRNWARGAADAVDVLAFDPSAIVLQPRCWYDITTGEAAGMQVGPDAGEIVSALRTERLPSYVEHAELISKNPMAYDFDDEPELELREWRAAAKRASSREEIEMDFWFAFPTDANGTATLLESERFCLVNVKSDANEVVLVDSYNAVWETTSGHPLAVVTVPPQYLRGLIRGRYHWNNCEVGSQWTVQWVNQEAEQLGKYAEKWLWNFSVGATA